MASATPGTGRPQDPNQYWQQLAASAFNTPSMRATLSSLAERLAEQQAENLGAIAESVDRILEAASSGALKGATDKLAGTFTNEMFSAIFTGLTTSTPSGTASGQFVISGTAAGSATPPRSGSAITVDDLGRAAVSFLGALSAADVYIDDLLGTVDPGVRTILVTVFAVGVMFVVLGLWPPEEDL